MEKRPVLEPFPPADPGMERFVVQLPHKERDEEQDYRVELIAGKRVRTDGVNRFQLTGSLEPRNLEGWGYTYYAFTGPAEVIGTLMAPPPGMPAAEAFVSAAPLIVRYNSRLPIVVYVPRGLQVRYRVWSAGDETLDAERL